MSDFEGVTMLSIAHSPTGGTLISVPCQVERERGIARYPFAICAPHVDGLPGTAVLAVAAYRPHAELFAAAPDLLVAARMALKALEDELEGFLERACVLDADYTPIRSTLDDNDRNVAAEMEAKIATVAAAIAKAEGRS